MYKLNYYLGFIILNIIASYSINAQRLSLGYNLNVSAFQNIKLKDRYIFPEHSYFIYYAGNSERNHKPEHSQSFNAGAVGINLNLDYKRYMFTTELLGGVNSINLPVRFPSSLGSSLEEEYFSFNVSQSYWSVGLLALIKLTTHANGPFLQGGLEYSFNRFNEVQNDEFPFLMSMYTSKTEMYGTLYTNETQYTKGIIGFGMKKNDRYISLRYTQRILGDVVNYPTARFYQIDMVLAKTLNFQKLRKGYKIYLE